MKHVYTAIDESSRTRIAKAFAQVTNTDSSSLMTTARALGKAAIPVLAGYTKSASADVRLNAVVAVGYAGGPQMHNGRVVGVLIPLLSDSNANVRREAFRVLVRFPKPVLRKRSGDLVLPLASYVRDSGDWEAVLLLGDLGDASALATLRAVSTRAGAQRRGPYHRPGLIGIGYYSGRLPPTTKGAALMALYKLDDGRARHEIDRALAEDDISGRALAIEAIAYANDVTHVRALARMLDDRREAHNAARIAGDTRMVRVRDLAVNAIARICPNQITFATGPGATYSDEQINEVRQRLRPRTWAPSTVALLVLLAGGLLWRRRLRLSWAGRNWPSH